MLKFDAERRTSNAGITLLSVLDRRLGSTERLADCLVDRRSAARIKHTQAALFRQRVFSTALGCPDARPASLQFLQRPLRHVVFLAPDGPPHARRTRRATSVSREAATGHGEGGTEHAGHAASSRGEAAHALQGRCRRVIRGRTCGGSRPSESPLSPDAQSERPLTSGKTTKAAPEVCHHCEKRAAARENPGRARCQERRDGEINGIRCLPQVLEHDSGAGLCAHESSV